MRTHASYDVQIGLGSDGQPACILIVLDGLVESWPDAGDACSASLRDQDLLLQIAARTITLTGVSAEITALLQKGTPLVLKHSASGFETLAAVS